ncbi:MAG TPA: pitrilysin family protein [Candidatus Acidoferrales bacterium]|jgi:zinc protease|nr:pitrilysin family protein [Candidatus Acidoferrales bacterium]
MRAGIKHILGLLVAAAVMIFGVAGSYTARARARAPQSGANAVQNSADKSAGESEAVTRQTLKNGLRVVIVRDKLAPVATTVMNYLVGSDEAPAGFPGMAHAQEHMMFRGSPDLTAGQLANISAAMGGDFDADTQQTVTQYFFTVPAEDLDVALHIENLRMRGVLDTDKLWDQERGAIEQEVAQDLSNPEYVFYTKLLTAMFRGTPYEHDALGSRPSFDKTTGTMLADFHNQWYAPNNAILVIVGNVDPQKTLSEVQSLFGDIPEKKIPPRPPVKLASVSTQTLDMQTDLPYGLAVVSFRMPGYDSPDYAAADILGDVLSSQRGSLYALVPAGKALDAGFSLSGLPQASVAYAMAAYPQGGNGQALIQEIQQVLADDVKNGVPADLVEAEKRHELADEEFQKNSISGLAMEWSNALAVEGRQSPEDDIRAIEKVTAADVDHVAKKYLTQANAIVAVLTPQPSGKPTSSKSFGGAESPAVAPSGPVTLPSWAEQAVMRIDIPELTIHPTVTTLSNGIKLIVQPESISKSVTVLGHIKNNADLESPKGQEGVSTVVDQLFPYGTQDLDRIAFQKALDDIGANESAGTDFTISVLSDHFDRGMQLLADNVLHPALPEDAFKVVQQQTAESVAGQLQSPSYLATKALTTALYPKNDPQQREATPASVKSLTIPDVKDYYAKVFRPDLTVITVIGDVTPEQAQAAVEKYFGEWKASGPAPQTDLPPVPANSPEVTAVPDKSRVQVNVTLAETLGVNRFDPDYYALELGNHVLGGGFYATRLYQDLRENSGLVYFVSSSFGIGKTRSVYRVNYACDPQNVGKARAVVERDLKAMQNDAVSADELRRAKAMLLRQIPLGEASVDSIAGGLVSRATIGLPLDEPEIAAHHYVELNADQVKNAFGRWLRSNDLVQVTEGPNPQ